MEACRGYKSADQGHTGGGCRKARATEVRSCPTLHSFTLDQPLLHPFYWPNSHLTRETNGPSSPRIQTRPRCPLSTRTSYPMIVRYSAGSWKTSLAILTSPTTPTRGCGHSTMTTRRETRRRRHVKSYFSIYLIPRFIVDNTFLLSLTQRQPQYLLLYPTPTSRWRVCVEVTRGNRAYNNDQYRGRG